MDEKRNLLAQIEELNESNEKLQYLLNISKSMMSEIELDTLLQVIMEKVTHVMDADRSTLFLLDKKTNELWSKVAQGANINEIRFPNGMGIAGHVAAQGEIINIQDAYGDERFNQEIDKKTGYRTKSILTMPLKNSKGEIIGATQVLNKKSGNGWFNQNDEDLLEAFSSLAAISLENAIVYQQVHNTMKTFELFVPPKYLQRIAKEGLESIKLGNAEKIHATVVFSDIRSFTDLSETMTPDESLEFLNSYLNEMGNIIAKNDGFIDKFIGDAIMAIYDHSSPDASIDTAIQMRKQLDIFNENRINKNETPIEIGIGINTGEVIVGTIGSNDRMDSTVIGDTVNLASRMEGLTKIYKCRVLICDNTLEKLENAEKYCIREIDTVKVKGKKINTTVYEIYDYEDENTKELKKKINPLLIKGRELYRVRKWDEAIEQFREALEASPDDIVPFIFMDRCKKYKTLPPPDNWDGAYKLEEK